MESAGIEHGSYSHIFNQLLSTTKTITFFLLTIRTGSIIEMKESGEFVFELILKDENGNKFNPNEMTFISSEILGVKCVWGYYEEGKIFFFWRDKNFLHF